MASTAKIVIKDITLHGEWKWNNSYDTCPICRESLTNNCITCINTCNNSCKVVNGKCGHYYHYHCIQEWLTKKNVCPMCNCNWQYEQ